METIRKIIRNTEILNDFLKYFHQTGKRFKLSEIGGFLLHLYIGDSKHKNRIFVKEYEGKPTIEIWLDIKITNVELNRVRTYRIKKQSGVKND